MNSLLLIDAVVRHTVVFIAQLSTAEGARSPLTRVADEVFVSLVRELGAQGLGKKVVADLFGLTLRSYQRKVQRLSESVTARGVTLWGGIHAFVAKRGSVDRADILQQFALDEEVVVGGVLDDLVQSGLVRCSSNGEAASYRTATADELAALGLAGATNSAETNQALAWVHVYRLGPLSREQLAEVLPLPDSLLDDALGALVADGRVRLEEHPDGAYYSTERCLIPVGESAGWEAAIIDHHQAVLNALAAKVVAGCHRSTPDDKVGGTTVSYDLWPGHPKEREVQELLTATRQRLTSLWHEVEDENRKQASTATYRLDFYCGQYLTQEELDE